MTELEILARQIGANERTLRRAISQGTLRAERPSPRKLKLGAAEKEYLRRSWSLLASIREILRTEQNVRFALLFGSVARGEDAASSDVDLLIDMRDPSLPRVLDLGEKLERRLGRRVDLVTLEEARRSPRLLLGALDEGRVLVDRDDRWPSLQAEVSLLRRRGRETKRRALSGIDRMLAGEAS